MRAGAASPGNGLNAGSAGGAPTRNLNRVPSSHRPRCFRAPLHCMHARAAHEPREDGGSGGGGGGRGGGGPTGGGDEEYFGRKGPHEMRLWTFLFAGGLAAVGVSAFVSGPRCVMSLGVSLAASAVLVACARGMVGTAPQTPIAIACGVCILIFFEMSGRYAVSKSFMPAGLVAGSSLMMVAGYFLNGL
ncbi:hypothetical protein FOA52_006457 [Chlamydomonas sp. UWO 241]|nr:hypothetical protein FOA52_006457 [Chlamydomonas sp. UWO 241]